jgi:hypothetical protein
MDRAAPPAADLLNAIGVRRRKGSPKAGSAVRLSAGSLGVEVGVRDGVGVLLGVGVLVKVGVQVALGGAVAVALGVSLGRASWFRLAPRSASPSRSARGRWRRQRHLGRCLGSECCQQRGEIASARAGPKQHDQEPTGCRSRERSLAGGDGTPHADVARAR